MYRKRATGQYLAIVDVGEIVSCLPLLTRTGVDTRNSLRIATNRPRYPEAFATRMESSISPSRDGLNSAPRGKLGVSLFAGRLYVQRLSCRRSRYGARDPRSAISAARAPPPSAAPNGRRAPSSIGRTAPQILPSRAPSTTRDVHPASRPGRRPAPGNSPALEPASVRRRPCPLCLLPRNHLFAAPRSRIYFSSRRPDSHRKRSATECARAVNSEPLSRSAPALPLCPRRR